VSEVPRRPLLWGLCAVALLLMGFAGFIALGARLAGGDAAAVERTRQSLGVYGAVVLLKGLLPQLLLTLGLYRLAAPRFGLERSLRRLSLGLAACALLAGVAVAGLLLPLSLPGWPAAVVYRSAGNFVATVLQLAVAVTLAALLPRLALPALR
jgi:hypothetical protein